MVTLALTPDQAAQMEPLLTAACLASGTVFCQARRLAFPDNGRIIVGCHLIPAGSSERLRAFLVKERERIDAAAEKKVAKPAGSQPAAKRSRTPRATGKEAPPCC